MILVRIDRVKGDVKIPGYRDWFVAESIGFGVGRSIEAGDSKQDLETGKGDEQELSIEKTVDSATVYLMHSAMKGRTGSAGSGFFSIDIHIVQNRYDDASSSSTSTVKPFIKIRIENAMIKEWDIDASGDERPSESLRIWFNRAAMKYRSSADGKVFETHGPLGWDEHTNRDWKSDELLKTDE